MNLLRLASFAAALLLSASVAAHAQMPTDNDAWKGRCAALSAMSTDLSHVPGSLVAMTRGVPGSKFTTFAFDRDAAGQHNVACTLFFLGAVADQAGNGGKADSSLAHDEAVLGTLQVKAIHGQSSTFSESLTRTKAKAREITRPALTVADEQRVLDAATTIPFATAQTASAHPTARPISMDDSHRAHLKR